MKPTATTDVFRAVKKQYNLPLDQPVFFDRVGPGAGFQLFLILPEGPSSWGERCLPPFYIHYQYHRYQVIVDDLPQGWRMSAGPIAPKNGQKGGAIQFLFMDDQEEFQSAEDLIRHGLVTEVPAE